MGFCFPTGNMFHFISYFRCTSCPFWRRKLKATWLQGKKDHNSEQAWRLTKLLLKVYYNLPNVGDSIFLKCFFSTFSIKTLASSNHKVYCKPIEEQGLFRYQLRLKWSLLGQINWSYLFASLVIHFLVVITRKWLMRKIQEKFQTD